MTITEPSAAVTINSIRKDRETTELDYFNDLPQLPKEALYGIAGDIVKLATRDSEADPAAVLISVLVRAGATVGCGPHFMVGETRHTARLYAVKVGATSRARKGTSEGPVARIFERENELTKMPVISNGKFNLDAINTSPLTVVPGPLSTGDGVN